MKSMISYMFWHHLEGKDPDWFIPDLQEIENSVCIHKYSVKAYSHIQVKLINTADNKS